MRANALLLTACFVTVLLAGCAGGAAKGAGPSTGPAVGPAEFDADTGGVEGVIMDDENQPVAEATIALIGHPHEAVSGADGKFSFHNVAPGEYTVAAQKLGYESGAKKIEVKAAEVTSVTFLLAKLFVGETPFHESWGAKGFFECSWTGVSGTGPCFFSLVGPNSTVPVDPWTRNKRQFDYTVKPGVFTAMNELTWSKTTAATGDKMSVFLSYVQRPTTHWYCNYAAASPVVLRWDRGALDDKEGTCARGSTQVTSGPKTIPIAGQQLTARVNTGPGNLPATSIGMAFQQDFEIWFSNFYWEAAPDEFSALPEG